MTISDLDYRLPTPFDYGARHESEGVYLSDIFNTLAEARVEFKNASSLQQSINWLALERAIEDNPGKTVLITQPLICNFPLLIKNSITIIGMGIGDTNIPHQPVGTPTYTIQGDGASFRTVQTRQRYRGSVNDAPDEPINMAFNVQAAGVTFMNMWGHCKGTNWDHHIFSGTRRQLRVINCSLTGSAANRELTTMIQRAAVLCDGSQSKNTTPFKHYDYNAFSPSDNPRSYPAIPAAGADGFEMRGCRTWGCRWDVMVLGAQPKKGLRATGKTYEKGLTITFQQQPSAGNTITFGDATFSFVTGTTTADQEVEIKATLADTLQELVSKTDRLLFKRRVDLPLFNAGSCLATATQINVFAQNPKSNVFGGDAWTATTNSPDIISIPNTGKPVGGIPDPAPYYNSSCEPNTDANGSLIIDDRTTSGMSDIKIIDNTFSGTSAYSGYWIEPSANAEKRWDLEGLSSGNIWISGLANTPSCCIHKIEVSGNRLQSPRQIFGLRLGYVAGILIQNNFPDGASAEAGHTRYGYMTSLPGITVDKVLINQPSTFIKTEFPLEPGDCYLVDHNGESLNTSAVTAPMFKADARSVFQGAAESRYIAGPQGSTALRGYTSDGATLHWSITGQNDGGLVEIRNFASAAANKHVNIYNCRMIADTSATLNLTSQLTILRVTNTSVKIAMCGTDGVTRYSAPITLS